MDKNVNRGIFFLLCFFLLSLLLARFDFFGKSKKDFTPTVVLEPLTTQAKILLGYRLPVNTLTPSDWDLLPGVGPSLSLKILRYSESHGPFRSPEDLLHVPGFGRKKLEKVKPFLE